MATFIPSKYQKAVYEAALKGDKNIIVSAVAGSGKSTTIVNLLDVVPKNQKKVFLAFNKAIVEALKDKVKAPNTEIKTLHSAGFTAMMFTYKSRLDTYKYKRFLNDSLYMLSSEITIDTADNEQSEFKSRVIKLLDLSRAELATNVEVIEKLALEHEIEIQYDEAQVVLKLMDWGVNQFKLIDYTDMIWIPVMKKLRLKTYDWVLVDECQDLSNMQRELFQMMMNPKNGKFIAVGDRKQAINWFAGAGNDSFDRIAAIPDTIELPLSICYRCDSDIIKEAKDIVPQVEARDNAPKGIVKHITDFDKICPKQGDMILSRVSAPLVSVCMKLILNGIPAYVKGREIGQNLIALVKRTKQLDLSIMFDILQNELYKMQVKIARQNKISMEEAKDEYAYINLQDKIECLNNLCFGCLNTKELIDKIDTLFKDYDKGICLSTIHKAKGLEADRVFVIATDKLPLKKAMNNPIQAVQEMNLKYVCVTRAKHELYFVDGDIKELKINENV